MSSPVTENAPSVRHSSSTPRKRVITPARKAQNRAAQQAYRDRQKERKSQAISQRGLMKKLVPRPSGASQGISPDYILGAAKWRDPRLHETGLEIMKEPPQFSLADPRMNNLRSTRDTILEAVLNNAVCLGFDLTRLSDCRQSYISPFYRSIKAGDEPRDLVASTLDTTIPVHLQPTMAQILIPHHASLDLIPLPLVRDRVIMMSFSMPQIFDLWDLKLDIYVREALVYRSEGESQSWDQSSWKAMSWFLQKWCLDRVRELVVSEGS